MLYMLDSSGEVRRPIGQKARQDIVGNDDDSYIDFAFFDSLLQMHDVYRQHIATTRHLNLDSHCCPLWASFGPIDIADRNFLPAANLFKFLIDALPDSLRTVGMLLFFD